MDSLPTELFGRIAEKVGLGEAVSLEGVSRSFRTIVCKFFWGNITALCLDLDETVGTENIFILIRLRPTGNLHKIWLKIHHVASLLTKIAQSRKITWLGLCPRNVSGISNNQVLRTLAGLELTGIQHLGITMSDGWGSDLDDRDYGPWLEQARLLSTNFLATNTTTLKTLNLQLRLTEDHPEQRQMKTMMREAFREPLRSCTHLEELSFGDIIWPTLPHNPLWSAVVEGGNSNLKTLILMNTPNNNPFLQREAENLVDTAGSLEELSIRHYLLMASIDRVRIQYIHPSPFLNIIRLSVFTSSNETRVQNGVSRRFPQLRQLEINDAESLPIHILEFLRLNANQQEAKDLKIVCWDSSNFRDCHFRADDLLRSIRLDEPAVEVEEVVFREEDWPEWNCHKHRLCHPRLLPLFRTWLVFCLGRASVRVALIQPMNVWDDETQASFPLTRTRSAPTLSRPTKN